ncbi:MAG: riboflavin synthase [Planctomycetia bacterium]|nr:riboflavin synthase [Planctomycetia bacterium]
MFTGLVEALVEVADVIDAPPGKRLTLRCGALAAEAAIGESIAINGCCLTVVAREDAQLTFEAGPETLAKTNLGRLQPGSLVNVERSLCLGDRLGGHLVTGHVDDVGVLESRRDEGDWSTCWFRFPEALSGQLVSKGSITIDGVSLTVVNVEAERFSVALIPHTLGVTTLGRLVPGDVVNLETDLIGKYVEKQFALREPRHTSL